MSSLDHRVMAIFRTIKDQDWFAFATFFSSEMEAAASLLGLQQTRFLHALVQCNPPIQLVAKLIEALPDQLTLLDKRSRTVLHTAAGSTASPELIRLLARSYPAACARKTLREKLHCI
jgi:hypothetical protein